MRIDDVAQCELPSGVHRYPFVILIQRFGGLLLDLIAELLLQVMIGKDIHQALPNIIRAGAEPSAGKKCEDFLILGLRCKGRT